MEENIAILMADLSGYTALTETHGSASAADLIDKYMSIVESCLVGDSRLHERVGDEIMIVSDSPDNLMDTALMIGNHTSKEEKFLQIHGGLHFGKVLKRGNSYFGSAINLTSRIAAKAKAGTFLCSDEYVDALTDKTAFSLTSKGNQSFKNVNKELEVFEVDIEMKNRYYVDPVCRMLILNPQNAIYHPNEHDIYFCSSQCLNLYQEKHEFARTNS